MKKSTKNLTKHLEIWKQIREYEDYYVSNFGRVKSTKFGKEKILKQGKQTSGYLQVVLCKNGKKRSFEVHRLVLESFLRNPKGLPCCNHKNENKLDNRLSNLEWCDWSYNNNYGTRNERVSKKLSKKVIQYTFDGKMVHTWNSVREIEQSLGYSNGNISSACTGRYAQAYGYIWMYVD